MFGADIVEQSGGGRLNQIEDDIETAIAAVIGVGNIGAAEVRRELQEHVEAVFLSQGAEALKIAVVFRIHGDDIIKAVEILAFDLTAALRGKIDAAQLGSPLGAAVGGLADVPAADAGGIDADPVGQALAFDQRPEDTFGGGRAADVAETDKQNFNQGRVPIECNSSQEQLS